MRSTRRNGSRVAVTLCLIVLPALRAVAQAPPQTITQAGDPAPVVLSACYVPVAGVLYLIKQPGLLQACLTVGAIQHKETPGTRRDPKATRALKATRGQTGDKGAAGEKGPLGENHVQNQPCSRAVPGGQRRPHDILRRQGGRAELGPDRAVCHRGRPANDRASALRAIRAVRLELQSYRERATSDAGALLAIETLSLSLDHAELLAAAVPAAAYVESEELD